MRYAFHILIAFTVVALVAPGQAQAGERRSVSSVIRLEGARIEGIKERKLTIEIGDSTKAQFEPSFTIDAWEGECRFKVNLSTTKAPLQAATRDVTQRHGHDRTVLTTAVIAHEMFVTADGDYEWNVLFPSRPDTNVVTFRIETEGLSFYYQDTLADWEKAAGASRPPEVIGSYAVYHADRRGNVRHISGADTTYERYLTGKAFHIYRPLAWDSGGDTVWCALDIDTSDQSLTLTLPPYFWANAVYPVVVDPRFGDDGVGASSITSVNTYWHAVWTEVAPEDGTVDSVAWYAGYLSPAGTVRWATALWDEEPGAASEADTCRDQHAYTTVPVRPSPATWRTHEMTQAYAFNAGDTLWQGWWCAGFSNQWLIYYDTPGEKWVRSYGTESTPAIGVDFDYEGTPIQLASSVSMSAYIAYTAVTTSTPSRRRKQILGGE